MAMDVRKGIFVLLVLFVTLVSGYSKYRVRPVSKSVYRHYVDKYRGYRNSYAGYYPNRRPGYRSLGQFIGRDFHLQRSLPRFKSGYQKGDQYLNRGRKGVLIRPIPKYRLPPPLQGRPYRPSPTRCPKYETLVCSPAPYNMRSGKCFSICRNGKPCYKPCSCTCVPSMGGKFKGSKLLPLGKKSTIPFCKKSQLLRCSANKYSPASHGLCVKACADGVCPISCNCQCVVDRQFIGGGVVGFSGRNGGQRRGVGFGGNGGSGFGGGSGQGFGGNGGGGFGGGGGGGGGGFGGNGGGGFGGRGGGGFGGNGGGGFGGGGRGGGGFGGGGFGGGGGGGFNGGGGFGGGGGGGGGFGGNGGGGFGGGGGGGFDGNGGGGFGGGGGGGGGFGGNGGGGFGGGGGGGFGGNGGGGGFGGGGIGIGQDINGGIEGPGIGFDNGLDFGNELGIDNGLGIAVGSGGTGQGFGGGVGNELDFGNGVGAGGVLGLGGGFGLGNDLGGISNDVGVGISNDIIGNERDFRSFTNNGAGQIGVIGEFDQGIPIDFSKLQAIDRLDFPLDGTQRIPEMLEPELSLMDSIPEMNGPALIDPGLGASNRGRFLGINAPDMAPVGLDTNALQDLSGLVGGPFDPILDIGAGRAPSSKSRKKSKSPKKVTETVDIKVDVIKKGGNKKPENGNRKGRHPGAKGVMQSGSGSVPFGANPGGAGLLPGDIVDPSAFFGGASGGGGRGRGIGGRGALVDQGMENPLGILMDGQINGAGAGGVHGDFGASGGLIFQGGPQDALGIDAIAGIPGNIDLQNGHFGPESIQGVGASGTGGKSGIIGFDGLVGQSGGLGLDAFPADAGALGVGAGAGNQAFDNQGLIDPMLQASNGFNDQMTFLDPTQPNGGPHGEIPMGPDAQHAGASASGGNINLDLASLLPGDVLGGLDLTGGSNAHGGVSNKNMGGPGEQGHSGGGVIGLADLGGAASGKGGASGGNGRETMESCLSRGEELWCDAKPSWGSTPGVQGWCNTNCQNGACNYERCECSCISGAEFDFRMSSSASQKF